MGLAAVFLVFCGLSFLLSFLLTAAVKRAALGLGFLDHPASDRKQHREPIPLGGGIALFLGTWLPVWAGVAATATFVQGWWPAGLLSADTAEFIQRHGAGVLSRVPQLAGICGLSLGLLAMGLVDDRRGMSPVVKLGVQFAAAAGLLLLGFRITVFFSNPLVTGALTLLWVVGITNAFNLLDNMDGLCAGVALVSALLLAIIAAQMGQLFILTLLICLSLALLAFLCFNFPPASLFMGDAGSHFIGFILATVVVGQTFLHQNGEGSSLAPLFAMVMPVVVMAVPLYDTATVLLVRLRDRRPLYLGDRSHFSHRLLDLGLSPREALLLILIVSLTVGLPATILSRATVSQALIVFFQAGGILLLVALLERAGRRRR